ncbi:MAG: hypothetical protein R3Y53_02955 [Bacillota bacterium]
MAKQNGRGNSYGRTPNRNDYSMYQYGNAARELAPQYEEDVPYYEEVPRKKRKPSSNQKRKKGSSRRSMHTGTKSRTATAKPKTKQRQKVRKKPMKVSLMAIQSVAMVFLIFAGAIAFMTTKVQVDNISFEIRQANEELKGLQDMNAILAAELANEVDLDYIKSEAVNRLGMAEPQPYQIIHIDVPKTGYTVQYTDVTE